MLAELPTRHLKDIVFLLIKNYMADIWESQDLNAKLSLFTKQLHFPPCTLLPTFTITRYPNTCSVKAWF